MGHTTWGPWWESIKETVRHWVGEKVGMLCDMWGLYDVLERLGSRLKSINSTGLEMCFVLSYLSHLLTTQAGLKKCFQLFIVWKCVHVKVWGLNKDRLGGECLYPENHLIGFLFIWKHALPLSYLPIPPHKHFCLPFNTVGSIQIVSSMVSLIPFYIKMVVGSHSSEHANIFN